MLNNFFNPENKNKKFQVIEGGLDKDKNEVLTEEQNQKINSIIDKYNGIDGFMENVYQKEIERLVEVIIDGINNYVKENNLKLYGSEVAGGSLSNAIIVLRELAKHTGDYKNIVETASMLEEKLTDFIFAEGTDEPIAESLALLNVAFTRIGMIRFFQEIADELGE